MNRLYEAIVLPLIKEIKPNVIVEVGAEKGINTQRILNYCKNNNSKLISIDPAPLFNPQIFKNEFNGHFHFFNDLSLDVLPLLNDYDLILLDGDHNWYTVYNELKIIEKTFNQYNFPFIVLHDVSWPYARRDLYYNPETIPSEFLHEYEQKPIYPGINKLHEYGLNRKLNNAVYENTKCNGVLTAVEDFIKESSLNLSFYSINAFHGLGIICSNSVRNKNLIEEIFKNSDISGILEKYYLKEILDKNNFINIQNQKINELNKINVFLEEKAIGLSGVNKSLEAQVVELGGVNKSLEGQVVGLAGVNKSLDDKIHELINENTLLSNENKHLTGELAKSNSRAEILSSTKLLLFNKFNDLEKDYFYLKDDISHLNNENNSLKTEISDITKTNSDLQSKIDDYELLIKEKEQLIDDIKKKNNKLMEEKKVVMSSKSWKLTAPLRKLMSLIRMNVNTYND